MISKAPPADFKKGMHVVACYIQHKGKFIVLHRHSHKSNGDRWGLPAGKMDEGETRTQAMAREIQEETGLSIPEKDLIYFDSLFVRHEDRDFEYHMFSTTRIEKPEVRISEYERTEMKWVTPEEALEMHLIYDLDECIRLFYKI